MDEKSIDEQTASGTEPTRWKPGMNNKRCEATSPKSGGRCQFIDRHDGDHKHDYLLEPSAITGEPLTIANTMTAFGAMVEMVTDEYASPHDIAAVTTCEEYGLHFVRVMWKQGGKNGWEYKSAEDAKAAALRLRTAVDSLHIPQFWIGT